MVDNEPHVNWPLFSANKLLNFTIIVLLAFEITNTVALVKNEFAPLWLPEANQQPNLNERLNHFLERVGPDMRASSDYHDYTDIQLNDSISAWELLHDQFQVLAQSQVRFYRPRIGQLLKDSDVSQQCRRSIDVMLENIQKLDAWAVRMWGATANFPPVGLLDGTLTDAGSYRGCMDVDIPKNYSFDVGQTSYCMVSFRPILPARPKFHQIFERVPHELRDLFDTNDIVGSFLQRGAQYFHYLYIRLGICVPSHCSAVDIQQAAKTVGKRLILATGPVRCHTRISSTELSSTKLKTTNDGDDDEFDFSKIENKPQVILINEPMNNRQAISLFVVATFFAIVFLASLWHTIEIGKPWLKKPQRYYSNNEEKIEQQQQECQVVQPIVYTGIKHVAFNYFSLITNGKDFLNTSMGSTEIKCLHGLRVITMIWIITVHTLQYNDWSGFVRVFDAELTLQDPILHPVYNANYVVDNFFLMSGLLAAYTIWLANKGCSYTFSAFTSLIGRYLRLTPQVLLISLLYIILPLVGDSPFWYNMTHHSAKYCEKNWWINLLHLQSFYREDEICNLVGWWISVDMFYYVLALGLIYMILKKQTKQALSVSLLLVGGCILQAAYRHYTNGYTPNNLGTVPQVAEVWTRYVVNFFWSPYPHAFPFYLGFWLGYVLANNKWHRQVHTWSRIGWVLAILSLATVNLSSHIWMSGALKLDNQYISTAYNNICTIIWSTAFGWVILACHYGCAPTLNKILSLKLFVLVSKASFIIYLSHMLLVRIYFGQQEIPLSTSVFSLCYIIAGNTIQSTIFGIFLCIAFEGPCMKFQKLVMRKIKPHLTHSHQKPSIGNFGDPNVTIDSTADHKVTIGLGATVCATHSFVRASNLGELI